MSFLTEAATRRMALSSRMVMVQAPRQFHTSYRLQKTAIETAKDAVKTVDRKVSDKLVDGINATTNAAQSISNTNAGDAKGKTQELKGEAAGKAQELKGDAKGAANEAAGKAKGAANKL